ncbi:hypothetical protein DPSP01_000102 [Paraphaeosphaeria sporulosa]
MRPRAAFSCALSLASAAGNRKDRLVVFEDASEEKLSAAVATESQLIGNSRDLRNTTARSTQSAFPFRFASVYDQQLPSKRGCWPPMRLLDCHVKCQMFRLKAAIGSRPMNIST